MYSIIIFIMFILALMAMPSKKKKSVSFSPVVTLRKISPQGKVSDEVATINDIINNKI